MITIWLKKKKIGFRIRISHLDNESTYRNRSFLANAVDSHNRLLFNCWIPPWILWREHGMFEFDKENENLFPLVKKGKKGIKRWKRKCTIKKTLDAAVKFNPTPPALKDINRTWNTTPATHYLASKVSKQWRISGNILTILKCFTIFSLFSLNSYKTFSLCFCVSPPS